jgi:hypothetical protein
MLAVKVLFGLGLAGLWAVSAVDAWRLAKGCRPLVDQRPCRWRPPGSAWCWRSAWW